LTGAAPFQSGVIRGSCRRPSRSLNNSLSHIDRRITGGSHSIDRRIAEDYFNPENPGETWAGRELKPLWLTAAIKSGKTVEEFPY
jgi:DNA-binding protein H-NS